MSNDTRTNSQPTREQRREAWRTLYRAPLDVGVWAGSPEGEWMRAEYAEEMREARATLRRAGYTDEDIMQMVRLATARRQRATEATRNNANSWSGRGGTH